MESYLALKNADEVRTFPSITMPAPVFKIHTAKTTFSKTQELLANRKKKVDSSNLPGLLKATKSSLASTRTDERGNIFTGHNSANMKLDVNNDIPAVYDIVKGNNNANGMNSTVISASKGVTRIDLTTPFLDTTVPPSQRIGGGGGHGGAMGGIKTSAGNATTAAVAKGATAAPTTKTASANDAAIEELRNYLVLMDQYSLHNFLIYEGRTLKETPEYQSFQRAYSHKWGAIISIIYQLEEFLTTNEVKLAIINGPQVYELAKLNLPTLPKPDLYACIANIDQVEATIGGAADISKRQMLKFVVKLQAVVRMFLSLRRYKKVIKQLRSAVIIQSAGRLFLARMRFHRLQVKRSQDQITQWISARQLLKTWWQQASQSQGGEEGGGRGGDTSRLQILLPSISTLQYLRLEMENLATLQNTQVTSFYQLADPTLELIYLTPFTVSHYQLTYQEKLLALLNISTLPKRLTMLCPEGSDKLPGHFSLAQQLWYSPIALNKLKYFINRSTRSHFHDNHNNHHSMTQSITHNKLAYIVPGASSSFGWAEKRIAYHLSIPLLGPEPMIAETISSRSFLKTFFMESSVNIPIGAHDIYSIEDLMVAITRLISCNLGMMRWMIRLNYDHNQESSVIFDVEKLSVLPLLRVEQLQMIGENDNLAAWFSRATQLTVRRRLLNVLRKEFVSRLRIGRKDIYGSWSQYVKYMKTYGAVIEAEPIQIMGLLTVACFINPLGEITIIGTAQRIVDEYYQIEAYAFPQTIIPETALASVSQVLLERLHSQFDVIGYLCLHFTAYWDALVEQPRIWATDLSLGHSSLHGAIGQAAVLLTTSPLQEVSLNLDNLTLPEDRSFLYVPLASHPPLKGTHDDHFFKLCRMRGIAFDTEHKIGTLFFLPDTIMTGSISILSVGRNRLKALELATMTLGFVQKNYGIDKETNSNRRANNLSKILVNLRKMIRMESGGGGIAGGSGGVGASNGLGSAMPSPSHQK